jgi:hypothetical protein
VVSADYGYVFICERNAVSANSTYKSFKLIQFLENVRVFIFSDVFGEIGVWKERTQTSGCQADPTRFCDGNK